MMYQEREKITTAMSRVNERGGNASTRGTGIREKQRQFIYSNLQQARSVSQIARCGGGVCKCSSNCFYFLSEVESRFESEPEEDS